MKCNYCKSEEKIWTLGVSGAYRKEWHYCKEDRMKAKAERDAFLVKKGLPIFDRTPSHEDYYKEHVENKLTK